VTPPAAALPPANPIVVLAAGSGDGLAPGVGGGGAVVLAAGLADGAALESDGVGVGEPQPARTRAIARIGARRATDFM
jgi:hypothetical protein